MSADRPSARFATWLLRPYLDLGTVHEGPLHARAIDEGWTAFVERRRWFQPQRALPPGFRAQLDAIAPAYALTDPRQLPHVRRTPRWQSLCEALEAWSDLAGDQQCRLASLLHSMCLYQPLMTLIPPGVELDDADEHGIELAWWRAAATYMLGFTMRASRYHDADLSVFEKIALGARDAGPPAFNAAVRVFVHLAKIGAPVSLLTAWGEHLEAALAAATAGLDAFTAGLLASRFHRAIGFLPQRHGDRDAVVRAMDEAERMARALTPVTSAEVLLYRENLHALMESRTKEALWLGDLDQALARGQAVVDVDPYDAKVWVEIGEVRARRKEWREAAAAYATAATLGPPATALARHMAGRCLREASDDALAALMFKDALEADPLGLSPREEIARLPSGVEFDVLRVWSRTTVEW